MRTSPQNTDHEAPDFIGHLQDIHLSCVYISWVLMQALFFVWIPRNTGFQALPTASVMLHLSERKGFQAFSANWLPLYIHPDLAIFQKFGGCSCHNFPPRAVVSEIVLLGLEQKYNNQYSIITFMLTRLSSCFIYWLEKTLWISCSGSLVWKC